MRSVDFSRPNIKKATPLGSFFLLGLVSLLGSDPSVRFLRAPCQWVSGVRVPKVGLFNFVQEPRQICECEVAIVPVVP